MSWDPAFEAAFNPNAIAVVGASADPARANGGTKFVAILQELGFPGGIYPINPDATEIRGLKAYPKVSAAPEHTDLVIIAVPAQHVEAVLEDCIAANARNIQIFTAGFEETGDEQRKRLGERVQELVRLAGLRVLGPNCMGLYVPSARIGNFDGLPAESGPVAVIAQSGSVCNWLGHYGKDYGIRYSKVISFGNAYGFDSTDLLEYLAGDHETQMICMYLEGVKDGGKLLKLVREINSTKPVILLKGGLTESGARAVSSHTGKLAGQEEVWKAFFKQTGAVSVDSLEEIVDMAMTFLCVAPPSGRRVGLILTGGGSSVLGADLFAREGLETPPLAPETQRRLRDYIPVPGSSIRNPLDIYTPKADDFIKIIETVAADQQIDMVIVMPEIDHFWNEPREEVDKLIRYFRDSGSSRHVGKPMAVVFYDRRNNPRHEAERRQMEVDLPRAGFPVYRSLPRVARSLARLAAYHSFLRETSRCSVTSRNACTSSSVPRESASDGGNR